MRVLIAGGSGFIGTSLVQYLLDNGYAVTVADRRPPSIKSVPYHCIDLLQPLVDTAILAGHDAVIQLCGEPINRRWNYAVKKLIYDSRVKTTRHLVAAISRLDRKPASLVCASAVGYYGNRGEETLTELSSPGQGFLATVCRDSEAAARAAQRYGLRVFTIRTAPVLGRGGMLQQMLPFYRWGLGGPLGAGRQWFPWVHMSDLIRIYTRAATQADLQGPINAVDPGIVRQKEFARALGQAMHRPAFLPTPPIILRLLYGELASALTASAKVIPRVLTDHHYTWQYTQLRRALETSV